MPLRAVRPHRLLRQLPVAARVRTRDTVRTSGHLQLRARGVLVLGLPARGLDRRASTDSPRPPPARSTHSWSGGKVPWTGSGVLAVLTRLEMLTRIDAYRDDEVSRAFPEPAYALDVPSVSCLPPSRRPAPTWSPTPASDAKPGPTGTFG